MEIKTDYKFTDIADINELQELLNRFDKKPDIPFSIIDAKGNTLLSSPWIAICPDFRSKVLPEGNKCPGNKLSIEFFGSTGYECHIHTCNAGLVSIEIPLFFEDRYLATAISGQFFFKQPDIEFLKRQEACKFMISDPLLSFISEVPVLSKADIYAKVDCFCTLTDLLLSRGLRDLKIKSYESRLESCEMELASDREKLTSLQKMKSELISSFSHELKTPLSIIKGYAELLYDGCLGQIDEDQKKALDTSLFNIGRLERIVDSLLYLGMEHSNEHFYEYHPTNMLEIIEAATVSLTKAFDAKNIMLRTNFPENVSVIYGDSRKLFQVLSHLLDNAIKFSPSGSTVTISLIESNEVLHLSVQDMGIGIIEDQLSRIFDGFYQADSSLTRKYPGVGIGLNICQRIIKHHKGNITIESKVNEGSTFHIELPVKNSFTNGVTF